MTVGLISLLGLLVAALIVAYSSLFTIYQTQQALVLRLGQPRPPITEPGLHVKAPFIDSVVAVMMVKVTGEALLLMVSAAAVPGVHVGRVALV